MNGNAFRVFIEKVLAPTLSAGDIVVMDNLPRHTVSGILEAIEAKVVVVSHLPPCSPDLNPFILVFSKMKGFL